MLTRRLIVLRRCPHCGSTWWRPGSVRGLLRTVYCYGCGCGYCGDRLPGGPYMAVEILPPQPRVEPPELGEGER